MTGVVTPSGLAIIPARPRAPRARREAPSVRRSWGLRVAAAGAALLVASVANAQVINTGADVLRFKPGIGGDDFLNLDSATVAPNLTASVSFFAGLANGPLVLQQVGSKGTADTLRVVNDLTWFDLAAGFSFYDHIEVAVAVPMSIGRGQNASSISPKLGSSANGFGIGDVRLAPKYSFFERRRPLQVAVSMPVSFPSGNSERFRGGGATLLAPRVAGELNLEVLRVVVNAGFLLRTAPLRVLNITLGQEVTWGVGGEVPLFHSELSFLLSVTGNVPLARPTQETVPVDGLAGFKYRAGKSLAFELAVGGGLTRGWAAPQFQVILGVSFLSAPIEIPAWANAVSQGNKQQWDEAPGAVAAVPGAVERREPTRALAVAPPTTEGRPPVASNSEEGTFRDADQDGVADEDDTCPDEKETINGVRDADGCPDSGAAKVGVVFGKLELRKKPEFVPGTATLTQATEWLLAQVALVLKANPTLKLRFDVYCTELKDRLANEKLSMLRAKTLREALIRLGVSGRRVQGRGWGMVRPLEPSSVEVESL